MIHYAFLCTKREIGPWPHQHTLNFDHGMASRLPDLGKNLAHKKPPKITIWTRSPLGEILARAWKTSCN